MTIIDCYREWYEHERDCNEKMLAMIESVPQDRRADTRFQRAVVLAAHLAACRENWLDRMIKDSRSQVSWWPEDAKLGDLRPRYEALENVWADYLSKVDDAELARNFEFKVGDARYQWNVEGQIFQLVGHSYYHRGQIAMIVDELGGSTQNTDYLFWAYPRNPVFGLIAD